MNPPPPAFNASIASNALTAVVQMYASMLIDAERREKLLLLQIVQLQGILDARNADAQQTKTVYEGEKKE